MGFTEEMSHLAGNIIESFDSRVKFLGQNVADVRNLRCEAQKTLGRFHKEHRAMGRKLRSELGAFMEDLTGTVNELQEKFHREHNAVRMDQKAGHQAFQRMAKTLATRRHNFKGDLKKATDKAVRAQ